MADFNRSAVRFVCGGLSLNAPQDLAKPNGFPRLTNMRSYTEGTIEPRPGTTGLWPALPSGVHSIFRLNDPTPLNGGIPAARFVGSGGGLYLGQPNDTTTPLLIDTGYSGDPLTAVAAQPQGTVQPWLYVVDRQRQRKFNTAGLGFDIGITQPNVMITSQLQAYLHTVISDFDAIGGWNAANTNGGITGALSITNRVNTNIADIEYDTFPTQIGYASVLPLDTSNIGIGTRLLVGTAEEVIVTDLLVPVSDTTIAGIIYDSGTSGFATIQPTNSLGTGQLQAPDAAVIQARAAGGPFNAPGEATLPTGQVVPTAEAQIRTVDFPVNCLVQINLEWTRIISVAIGKDGVQSFRCFLQGTHAAGESIAGAAGFRAFFTTTRAKGDAIEDSCLTTTLTPVTPDKVSVCGIQTALRVDCSQIGVQTATPSGSSQGSFPNIGPPTGFGNNSAQGIAIVTDAKAHQISLGQNLSTPCGLAQVVIEVAQRVGGFCGVLRKLTGPLVCNDAVYGQIEADTVVFPNGQIIYCFAGPLTTNTPTWGFGPADSADRYIPVGPPPPNPQPPAPPPTPTPAPTAVPTSRATSPDDELHLSVIIDGLANVSEIRVYLDINNNSSTFSENYYCAVWRQSDLASAIQAGGIGINSTIPQAALLVLVNGQLVPVPPGKTPAEVAGVPNPTVVNPNTLPNPGTIALGNATWVELRQTVAQLIRVGENANTLKDVQAVLITVTWDGTRVMNASFDSLWLGGGFNPDVGEIGVPYTYTYRWRSKLTGATSNWAPPQSAGVNARRQAVELTATSSTDPQSDTIDYARFGGSITAFQEIGSSDNTNPAFLDVYGDQEIAGGEGIVFDDYQPWPTPDLPRKGACQAVGNAILYQSGDPFNPQWAPGSQLLVNGIACTLLQSPTTTLLFVVENVGNFATTTFEVPSAVLLRSPNGVKGGFFKTWWGPFNGSYFSIDDYGRLVWTKGNNPDSASDTNFLLVTSGSEPLINGFVRDGSAFVWSSENLYKILVDPNDATKFVTQITPCGRGLWSTWAFDSTPEGVVFLTKDGMAITDNGAPRISITDPDLFRLFPHDGEDGEPVNGYFPPDMTQPTRLRVAYVDGYVYFDHAVVIS